MAEGYVRLSIKY